MIGVSCMGWNVIDYTNKESVIRHFEQASMITKCIEIPFIPLTWALDVKKKIRNNKINIYSMHLPKQVIYLDNDLRKQVIIATNYLVDQLNIKKIIIHPFEHLEEENKIIDILESLELIKTQIVFELTNQEFMKQLDIYSVGKQAGLTVDISHYMRIMQRDLTGLFNLTVDHVHLRGYSEEKRYARIQSSIDTVQSFLHALNECNYSGNIMLEYPYSRYEDVVEDIKIIKRLLGESNGLLL